LKRKSPAGGVVVAVLTVALGIEFARLSRTSHKIALSITAYQKA
jgi:hypothetical protein